MSPEQIYQLHIETLALPKKEAKARRAAFARLHGLTDDAVYRRVKKLRVDGGKPKPARIDPQLEEAVNVVWQYKSSGDGQLSTEQAQQIALSEGALHREHPISSLNQAARRLGVNPAAAYCQRMEAAYANQAHRVDASGSRHFRVIDRDGDDWIVQVCRAEQRNKRWHDGELAWIVSLIDDYSRVMNARYVVAPGESSQMVQSFCVDTWRNGMPKGMPEEYLICDQGSFGSEGSTTAFLDFFGIELITGQPGNSQRNGRIERPFRPIKEAFEQSYLITHKVGARMRLSSLQEELSTFIRLKNERRHPIRRSNTKRQDWDLSIGFRGMRECPEDALFLAVFRQPKKVTAEGWVWHDNKPLEIIGLPPGLQGREVTLVYNRQGEFAVEHDGHSYGVIQPIPNALGEYKGEKETPAKQVAKAAAQRPRKGVGIYSEKGQANLRAVGQKPTASGQPVKRGEATPKVVTPKPRLRPARPTADPFTSLQAYKSLKEARRRIDEIVGVPLHTRLEFNGENMRQLENRLRECGLDRRATEKLGNELKQALRL
ncbi:MAG: transposase family protein [Candidatus Glassbacteria bacterium]|nr:transposase family protein [Candidatus Glassbacteria bacterium]